MSEIESGSGKSLIISKQLTFTGSVRLSGHLINGGVLSSTVMEKEHCDSFCEKSMAVYVTVVVPRPKMEPGLKFEVKRIFPWSHKSIATGSTQVTVAWQFGSASAVILGGQGLMKKGG